MDSCIGDHEPSYVDKSVHDLGSLEVDVDTDKREKPEGNEYRHHIDDGISEEGNFECNIFEWFVV